jgi:hypothetical protein
MWIFTTFGFFSVVQKPGTEYLTVRARTRDDLEALRARYVPTLSKTIAGGGTDYPFRATVAHDELADAMVEIVRDVTYSNFKNQVQHEAGKHRAQVYGRVWTELLALEEFGGKHNV